MMKQTFRLLSVPLALVLLLSSLGPSLALDRQTRLDVMSGVVQISLVKVQGGEIYYLAWGSGTMRRGCGSNGRWAAWATPSNPCAAATGSRRTPNPCEPTRILNEPVRFAGELRLPG